METPEPAQMDAGLQYVQHPYVVAIFCVLPPPFSHVLSLSIWTVMSGLMNELQPRLPSDFH